MADSQPATTESGARQAAGRLRRVARLRRRFAWALVASPVLMVLIADFSTRGTRLMTLPPKYIGSYSLAVLESALLWMSLLWVAAAQRGISRWAASTIFLLFFTLALGGQLYFHSQYSTYLNLDATLFGTSLAGSVFGQLGADGENFLGSVLPPLLFSVLFLVLGRKLIRPRRRSVRVARVLAPLALIGVFLIPCSYRRVQASTPDVIYFHAIGGLIKELTGVRTTAQVRPGRRTPPPLPQLRANQPVPRNVLLLLTESVRADCHCSVPSEQCDVSPEVNRAVPNRIPLEQLHSNATTTAIQLAVLWSGLEPTEPRERLHGVPLLFDYAHAAGFGNAYWTSHHMLFANSRLWVQDLPTDFQCGGSDVEPEADLDLGGDDGLLVDRALAELPTLKEPFFATVHVGNTHVPYKVDPEQSPFQPSSSSKDPDNNEEYRNFYKNAVFLQDKHVGRFLREFNAQPMGSRTVIIFTSDHGEAFREHGPVGHTGSLFEEELHVPGWVSAPPGTLSAEERKNLEAHRKEATFSTDMTPTVLDLMGLWDEPQLEPFKKGMLGHSWLRPVAPPAMLSLTNCSGVWGCAFRNWGVMQGLRKVHAREWDDAWGCYDLAVDPLEKNNLGDAGCADLIEHAERTLGGFPGAK